MEPIIRGIYVIHITLADLLGQAEAALLLQRENILKV
jgi:hypothetical protein